MMHLPRPLQHITVISVIILVMLANNHAVGVLSEAASGSDAASDIAAYKQTDKAERPIAPHAISEGAVTIFPTIAETLAEEAPAQMRAPQRREWPCLLPEGCDWPVESSPGAIAPENTVPADEAIPSNLESDTMQTDEVWATRYQVYQMLITAGSAPLLQLGADAGTTEDSSFTVHLLHGRADAQNNAHLIKAEGRSYPDIPPILVAAAIAEQASDIERVFGMNALEQTALALPGLENMSIGIAQIRPQEAATLGLGEEADLFDPETAIRGMYAKMAHADARIEQRQDPESPLALTDRYMLLSLAQNSLGKVDEFFALHGDWALILQQGNNARVMRYFIVHLDWLLLNGWTLSEQVDLDTWRAVVFSTPESLVDAQNDWE